MPTLETLSRTLMARNPPNTPRKAAHLDCARLVSELRKVLESPCLTGAEKNDVICRAAARVICQKDGADMVYHPGLFGESPLKSIETELMQ